jgi:hypothetical protein
MYIRLNYKEAEMYCLKYEGFVRILQKGFYDKAITFIQHNEEGDVEMNAAQELFLPQNVYEEKYDLMFTPCDYHGKIINPIVDKKDALEYLSKGNFYKVLDKEHDTIYVRNRSYAREMGDSTGKYEVVFKMPRKNKGKFIS